MTAHIVCHGCGAVYRTPFGRCPACGTPTVASVTQPAPADRHLRRCRGCGQWKDERVQCVLCHGTGPCPRCGHSTAAHSSEPGVGCLHFNESDEIRRYCPCVLPGTSQADQ